MLNLLGLTRFLVLGSVTKWPMVVADRCPSLSSHVSLHWPDQRALGGTKGQPAGLGGLSSQWLDRADPLAGWDCAKDQRVWRQPWWSGRGDGWRPARLLRAATSDVRRRNDINSSLCDRPVHRREAVSLLEAFHGSSCPAVAQQLLQLTKSTTPAPTCFRFPLSKHSRHSWSRSSPVVTSSSSWQPSPIRFLSFSSWPGCGHGSVCLPGARRSSDGGSLPKPQLCRREPFILRRSRGGLISGRWVRAPAPPAGVPGSRCGRP